MQIAVVGSGISGLAAAWLLSRGHEVHLFEAQARLGGHTHTHRVETASGARAVDSGFIVFNRPHYPLFCHLLAELKVPSLPSDMSFSVRNDHSGLEYNATSLSRLFCQRRNLLRPRFYRMVADILRFYRLAPELLDLEGSGPTTRAFLDQTGFSDAFRDDHLVPMASALWSAPADRIMDFPIRYMVEFLANHDMLQASGRPAWRVVEGGSSSYIPPLVRCLSDRVYVGTPVRSVRPLGDRIELSTDHDTADFDRVVLACHADEALALLADPDPIQQSVLGQFSFQRNEAVLHTDTSMLPRNRRAWAAWNARVGPAGDACTVTYNMNILQGFSTPEQFLITLNQTADIAPEKIIDQMVYHHPRYDHASVSARRRFADIDGVHGIHYCGAWWGWGFHEDGMRSALRVARKLGIEWG